MLGQWNTPSLPPERIRHRTVENTEQKSAAQSGGTVLAVQQTIVQYSTVRYCMVRYSTVRYSTVEYSTEQCESEYVHRQLEGSFATMGCIPCCVSIVVIALGATMVLPWYWQEYCC